MIGCWPYIRNNLAYTEEVYTACLSVANYYKQENTSDKIVSNLLISTSWITFFLKEIKAIFQECHG